MDDDKKVVDVEFVEIPVEPKVQSDVDTGGGGTRPVDPPTKQ